MGSEANILITGGSGYLGGSILAQIPDAKLPRHSTIFVAVRSEEQASSVRELGFSPLQFDLHDEKAVEANIVDNQISVVFFLIDATSYKGQPHFIKALAKVKEQTGRDVHFLHTSGAKLFSSHAGAPTDRPFHDDDADLYEIQKNQRPAFPVMQNAVNANNSVIQESEALGVRSYIFAPCIVYGQGQGFGNKISIQTVGIIKAAKAAGKVYRVDTDRPSWPVSHISDTTALYLTILRGILEGKDIGHGKNGYYLASSGSVVWDDLYSAIAKSLHNRGVVESPEVATADDAALEKMAGALGGPKEFVPIQVGGRCNFTARHGAKLGWESRFAAEHIIDSADDEVEYVLSNI